MADTLNKQKLQLRTVASLNGADKTPSPATKLLLSHGKPNFTLPRSAKQNGESDVSSAEVQSTITANNNHIEHNYNPYKSANGGGTGSSNGNSNNNVLVSSTKFNGVFRSTNAPVIERQLHQQTSTENEAAKVVLRRTVVPESAAQETEDDSVPEFIRRQRRIQERLAKENVLDFENRRSGYFTHTIITPTSPNRTSFVETMSSPAIVPALEIPPPAQPKKEQTVVESIVEEHEHEHEREHETNVLNVSEQKHEYVTNGSSNGHVEEEEVAKAIEEVNKAVEGEADDDEKISDVPNEEVQIEKLPEAITEVNVEIPLAEAKQEAQVIEINQETKSTLDVVEDTEKSEVSRDDIALRAPRVQLPPLEADPSVNGHVEVIVQDNMQNGHDQKSDAVPIVAAPRTNGLDGPKLPNPDPSGALGVNYEPKTVVSFSKDLSSEPNNYPDTVKVVHDGESTATSDPELLELAKLKFEIKSDEQDVQVTHVLKAE